MLKSISGGFIYQYKEVSTLQRIDTGGEVQVLVKRNANMKKFPINMLK